MEKTLKETEEIHSHLEQWFESLEVQKYSDRLKLVEERICIFKEVQAALFGETVSLGLNQRMTHKEANEKRKNSGSRWKPLKL